MAKASLLFISFFFMGVNLFPTCRYKGACASSASLPTFFNNNMPKLDLGNVSNLLQYCLQSA